MKKITLWLFALFASWQMSAQTGTIVVGVNDGTPNTTTGYPSPMQDYYKTGRVQFLYTASELLGAGLVAGNITEIGWVVTSNNTSSLQENYTISMKSTASTALTTTFETGAAVVYGPTNFTPSAIGNVMFTLSTPFVWDGTSNVIIEICAGLASGAYSQNVSCANSTTTGIKSVYYRTDSGTTTCTNATGTTSTDRPLLVATGNVASCLAPLNLLSSNVGAYSVDISWNASSSNPGIGYEYVVSTSNVAPSGAGTATTNISASVSSLLPQTTYYVFVRSNCAVGEFSGWNGPISFTTSCAPVSVPLLEPFATFLPNACWFNRTGGDLTTGPTTLTGSGWVVDGFANAGTTGAVKNEIYTTGANDWLISPEIVIPATGYELKFDAAATQFGSVNAPTNAWESDDTIEVLVSTTGLTNWTVLHTYNDTNQPSNVGTPNILDLSAYSGQNIRIAFRAVEGTANGSADIDFSIDNFQIRLTPACSEPISIITANVTDSSIDMSWTAPATAPSAGYEYVVSTSNTVPVTAGTPVATTFAIPSGLLSNTTYYIFVRSNCGASGFSTWTGPVSFTTACGVFSVPLTENFTTFLPSVCWFNRTGGDLTTGPTTLTGSGWVADGFANSGTTGAIKNEIYTTGANDWFISPRIAIPATGYELKFDAAATQFNTVNNPTNAWEADDTIEVLVSTSGLTNWTVLHTYDNSNQPSNAGTPNILDLDAYAGQDIRIAFRAVEGTANGSADIDFSIDNFEIRLTPVCSEPISIITANITDVSFDMSWTAPATAPSAGYEYVVSTSNTVPVTAGTPVATSFASPSGLLSNTTYYVFVRSNCGASGFSAWTGPVSFTTACGAYSVPMTENFATFLPSVCWFNRTGGDLTTGPTTLTGSGWVADGFANAGTTGAIKNEIFTTGANDWFISPRIAIPATGYELKFDAAATQFGTVNAPTSAWEADDSIEVLVSTTGLTNWTVLHTYNNSNQPSNAGTPNILDLDAYAGQNIRIAFRAVEGTANGSADIDFSIDNFQVRLTPTCIEPLNLVFSGVTFSSANISWDPTSPSPATGYEYFVSTSNTVPVTAGTATTNIFAALSGLLPETTYYVFVRSNCGAGDFSSWTGPISFYTGYCLPSSSGNATYVNNFTTTGGSQNISNLATGFTTGGYLNASTQFVEGFATSSFSFNAAIVGGTAGFSIWIDWNNDLVFNNATEKVYNTTAYGNGPFAGSITIPAGTPIGNYRMRINVDYLSTNPSLPCAAVTRAEFEDYTVSVIAPPACGAPSASVSGVTDVAANLNWAAVSSALVGYEYVLDNVATNPAGAGTATTAITYSASGLTASTVYYFHVRSVCGAGSFSTWSTISFTTSCAPVNVPYVQNFETTTVPNLPLCTAQQNVGTGNLWAVAANPGYGFTTNALRYTYNSGAAANVWFYTNGVNLTAGTDYKITYDYGSTGATYPEKLKVAYGTSALASGMTTVLADHTNVVNATPINNVVNFTPTVSGVYYFGFNAYSAANEFYLLVDNISVDVVLGNDSFNNKSFSVYPNPVRDILNIDYNENITKIQIVNMLDQEVVTKSVNNAQNQIDMSALTAGTYIVNITVDDTVHSIKVIKQ